MSQQIVLSAFAIVRNQVGAARAPRPQPIFHPEEFRQIGVEGGLQVLQAGKLQHQEQQTPEITTSDTDGRHLWAVRQEDTVHAPERSEFASTLPRAVIKHTNLTGGRPAFSAGEIIFLNDGIIALNGCSGRYGPRSKTEMDAVEKAFRDCGYGVWSMGFDEETGFPIRFGSTDPKWVS